MVTEGRQASGDGVVAAGLNPDVVRRVGVDQVNGRTVEQPVDVPRVASVAAEQPMIAENPQVARLGDRLVRRLGYLVGIGQTVHFAQEYTTLLGQLL